MIKILILVLFVGAGLSSTESEGNPEVPGDQPYGVDDSHVGSEPVEMSVMSASPLNALNLTSIELKLFSGFAINLVRTSCPSVNPAKLFQIHKYITKRISNVNPIKNVVQEAMNNILTSIESCSATSVKPSAEITEGNSIIPEPDSDPLLVTFDEEGSESEYPLDGNTNETLIDDDKPDNETDSQEVGTNSSEILSSEEELAAMNTEASATTTRKPILLAPKPLERLFKWISNIWSSFTSFFNRAFGKLGFGRKRRSIIAHADMDQYYSSMKNLFENKAVQKSTTNSPSTADGIVENELSKADGKELFTFFFDQVCAIYCKCTSDNVTPDFKIASKELLEFLLQDSEGLDVAASYLIDYDLVDQLEGCL